MYDNRYPNLRRITDALDRPMQRCVDTVCRRAGLDAAYCEQSRMVYFHIPGRCEIGVHRESIYPKWDDSRVEQIVRMTNLRKMDEKKKLALLEQAQASERHDAEQELGRQHEVFETESAKALERRRARRVGVVKESAI